MEEVKRWDEVKKKEWRAQGSGGGQKRERRANRSGVDQRGRKREDGEGPGLVGGGPRGQIEKVLEGWGHGEGGNVNTCNWRRVWMRVKIIWK